MAATVWVPNTHEWHIGDVVEITDGAGCEYGRAGDRGIIEELENRDGSGLLIKAKLTSGYNKGMVSSRLSYRYRYIESQWDE
jgi:hypothetical protein